MGCVAVTYQDKGVYRKQCWMLRVARHMKQLVNVPCSNVFINSLVQFISFRLGRFFYRLSLSLSVCVGILAQYLFDKRTGLEACNILD